jgi:hypothetical protein
MTARSFHPTRDERLARPVGDVHPDREASHSAASRARPIESAAKLSLATPAVRV